MEIKRKGEMPNATKWTKATKVQVEVWGDEYCVATYPLSNRRLPGILGVKEHDRFRLALWFKSLEEAEDCFAELVSGQRQIPDYAGHAERPELVSYVMNKFKGWSRWIA